MVQNSFSSGARIEENIQFAQLASPAGQLLLVSGRDALTRVSMYNQKHEFKLDAQCRENNSHPVLKEAIRQLEAYFASRLTRFDLPLAMHGTDFQINVWKELIEIPFGTTISYGELARRVGNPKASRAVGLANGRNPIAIIVPCHRVIGASGSLTGYGGGLARKKLLLELEQKLVKLSA